mgnify:CR=1 FL=1
MPLRLRLAERVSFRAKLVHILVAVILVGVLGVYLLVGRALDSRFQHLTLELGTAHTEMVVGSFQDYYSTRGSWDGVEALLSDSSLTMSAQFELLLTDPDGRVIAASDPAWRGRRVPAVLLPHAEDVLVNGRRVGRLVTGSALDLLSTSEREFLRSVTRAITLAGIGAAFTALLLGVFLVRQLTRPLHSLAAAAERVAAGDLEQRVRWNARDEIGSLARSFNRMTEELSRAQKLRRDLTADIAHELRNPLSVIKADLQAMADGIYAPSPERIASLQEEAAVLERLIEDLRTLSVAESGELRLHPRRVDAAAFIQQVVEEFRPAFQQKGVRLSAVAEATPVPVSFDTERMRQVFGNLLSNALRHTPATGEVTVTAEPQRHGVLFRVTDTGTGIAPEDLPYVFERFWRADRSRSRQSGGTGLGLAIARQLVEAHGGEIRAESTPGIGTSFVITLPRSAGHRLTDAEAPTGASIG